MPLPRMPVAEAGWVPPEQAEEDEPPPAEGGGATAEEAAGVGPSAAIDVDKEARERSVTRVESSRMSRRSSVPRSHSRSRSD